MIQYWMEIIQSFLFTSKYILNKGGNYDLYFLFAAILVVVFLIKDRKSILDIVKFWSVFAVLGIVMILCYPNVDILRVGIYEAKLGLCVSVMIYFRNYYYQFNWNAFAVASSIILGIETIGACIYKVEGIWRLNDVTNGFSKVRLMLTYIEPSELSFHAALLILYFLYVMYISKKNINVMNLIGLVVAVADLVLSMGMGGIVSLTVAIIVFLIVETIIVLRDKSLMNRRKLILVVDAACLVTGTFGTLLLVVMKSSLTQRVVAILTLKDPSFNNRYWESLSCVLKMFRVTQMRGFGFGNTGTEYALNTLEKLYIYPNSFFTFINEAGIFAVIILSVSFVFIVIKCIQKKDAFSLCLWAYIFIYQIPGGYFTNPINFMVYGIILGRLLGKKQMVESKQAVAEQSNG